MKKKKKFSNAKHLKKISNKNNILIKNHYPSVEKGHGLHMQMV